MDKFYNLYYVVYLMGKIREWIDPGFPGSLTASERVELEGSMDVSMSKPAFCPKCGSDKFIRKGYTAAGSQRCMCKECASTFLMNGSTLFPNSHINRSVWTRFCHVYLNGATLRHCSDVCDVCLKTAFTMKQRFIEMMRRSDGYCGVVFYGEFLLDAESVRIGVR